MSERSAARKRPVFSHRRRLLLLGLGATGLVVLGAGAAFALLLSGLFSTAATKQHLALTHWILEQGLAYSVRAHPDEIRVPHLADRGLIEQGFLCYRAHCAQCHGAPGVARDDLAKGQLPLASSLAQTGREWPPAELYWVTKKGIRMSGMPAWEFRVSEASLWSLVAFMKHLPSLTTQEYSALDARAPPDTCQRDVATPRLASAARGVVALRQYACTACHIVPGVVGAEVYVGPPLTRMANRVYLSGSLPNTPENLVHWIRDPRSVDPYTLMPDLDVTEAHARDMVAYLSTLE